MRRDAKESLIMPWHIFLSSDLLNHPQRLLGVVRFLRRAFHRRHADNRSLLRPSKFILRKLKDQEGLELRKPLP
jgi:hypothetical protein